MVSAATNTVDSPSASSTVGINGGNKSTSATSISGNNSSSNSNSNSINNSNANGKASPKRIEVDSLMTEFQANMGSNWDRYRDVITHFLIGKLTRLELEEELQHILDKKTLRLHNRFLLANLTNALQESPAHGGSLKGWSRKHHDESYTHQADSELAKLKSDIMGLSVRERKRIKAIARDTSKPTQPSTIIATRQAMLPKIPLLNEKENKDGGASTGQEKGDTSGGKSASGSNKAVPAASNPQVWTQEITHGYDAPLLTDSYELPDASALGVRMLGVSLEHGLLQGVDSGSTELMLAGLEHYLKDLVQQAFEKVKRRSSDQEDVITVEDISMILESSPNCFVEFSGPLYRLNDVMLRNDDEPMDDYGGDLTTAIGGPSVGTSVGSTRIKIGSVSGQDGVVGNGSSDSSGSGGLGLKVNGGVDGMHGLIFGDGYTEVNGKGRSEVGAVSNGGSRLNVSGSVVSAREISEYEENEEQLNNLLDDLLHDTGS